MKIRLLKEMVGKVITEGNNGYVVAAIAKGSNGNGAYKANNWFLSLDKAKKYFDKVTIDDFRFPYDEGAEGIVLGEVPSGILNRSIAKGRGGFLHKTDFVKIIDKK